MYLYKWYIRGLEKQGNLKIQAMISRPKQAKNSTSWQNTIK